MIMIKVKPYLEKNILFENNPIFCISPEFHKSLKAVNGIYDSLNDCNHILIMNNDRISKSLQKNEKIANVEVINNCRIIQRNVNSIKNTPEELLCCFKGGIKEKEIFNEKLNELYNEDIDKKYINEEHKIKLLENHPKIQQKPYKTSINEKKIIKEEIKKMLNYEIIKNSNSDYASPAILIKNLIILTVFVLTIAKSINIQLRTLIFCLELTTLLMHFLVQIFFQKLTYNRDIGR